MFVKSSNRSKYFSNRSFHLNTWKLALLFT